MAQVKDARRQARAAFQANAYAGFAEQAPHLRCLLENLPSRAVESGGELMSLDAVLERLRSEWMCQHPPGSHDGAVHAELRDDNERLSITFHAFLWGQSNEIRSFNIARVGDDEFVYWGPGQRKKT
jgi:hypothetical protein